MKKLLVGAALALAACSSSTKKAETTPTGGGPAVVIEDQGKKPAETDCAKLAPMTNDEATAAGLTLIDEMGAIFKDKKGKCKEIAAELFLWSERNQELIARMNCYGKVATEEQTAAFQEQIAERSEALSYDMIDAMDTCGEDEDFQQAMEEAVK